MWTPSFVLTCLGLGRRMGLHQVPESSIRTVITRGLAIVTDSQFRRLRTRGLARPLQVLYLTFVALSLTFSVVLAALPRFTDFASLSMGAGLAAYMFVALAAVLSTHFAGMAGWDFTIRQRGRGRTCHPTLQREATIGTATPDDAGYRDHATGPSVTVDGQRFSTLPRVMATTWTETYERSPRLLTGTYVAVQLVFPAMAFEICVFRDIRDPNRRVLGVARSVAQGLGLAPPLDRVVPHRPYVRESEWAARKGQLACMLLVLAGAMLGSVLGRVGWLMPCCVCLVLAAQVFVQERALHMNGTLILARTVPPRLTEVDQQGTSRVEGVIGDSPA
jgi:hypothetical protein